jgi:hypothetical protein
MPPKFLPMVLPLPLPPAFGHGGREPAAKVTKAGGLRLRLSAWLGHSWEVLSAVVEAEHLTHAACGSPHGQLRMMFGDESRLFSLI